MNFAFFTLQSAYPPMVCVEHFLLISTTFTAGKIASLSMDIFAKRIPSRRNCHHSSANRSYQLTQSYLLSRLPQPSCPACNAKNIDTSHLFDWPQLTHLRSIQQIPNNRKQALSNSSVLIVPHHPSSQIFKRCKILVPVLYTYLCTVWTVCFFVSRLKLHN